MFYCLTEYNTIRIENRRPCQEQEKNYYYIMDWDYESGKYVEIVIKKYSENVYDLIETGDLVKVTNLEGEERIIEINSFLPVKTHLHILEDHRQDIIAIYKEDKRKNYFIVWRK